MKKPNKPAGEIKPQKEFKGFGDDEPVNIPVSKKELDILFNGARALSLIQEFEEADSERAIGAVEVVLELTADPLWNTVSDLQGRYRDAELRAAGQLDRLEEVVKTIGGAQ
jgi:hypothetical protein